MPSLEREPYRSGAINLRTLLVVVIDDGSSNGTSELLDRLLARHRWLCRIRNRVPAGQPMAVRLGMRAVLAPVIVTFDGDGQNPPDQIPLLVAPFETVAIPALGLVQGEAEPPGQLAKRWASRAANEIRRTLLRDWVRDSGCGLKALQRDAYLDLPWFDHIHRFIRAMLLRDGWQVATIRATHREGNGGRSRYGNLARALTGIPDLLGAAWLIRRCGLPRHGVVEMEPEADPPLETRLTS